MGFLLKVINTLSRSVQKTTAAMVSQVTEANQVEHDGGRQKAITPLPRRR